MALDQIAEAGKASRHLRIPMDRLCYARIDRVVRKDGTVRIDNDLYEVNLALRG